MWRWFEHRQVYFPSRTMVQNGSVLGYPWQDVFFKTSDDIELNGWLFSAPPDATLSQMTALICHGNAGNISHRLDLYQWFLNLGLNVFAFDYRGYGRSAGKPSESGTYLDAVAAHEWLWERGVASSNIVGFGESLGGAVAAELATCVPLAGVVLQSAFTNIPALGREVFPWLPIKWICSIQYDTLAKIPRLNIPIMVMHSRADDLVGFQHAEANFAAANEPKFFCELSGDHIDSLWSGSEQFRQGIAKFFAVIATQSLARLNLDS